MITLQGLVELALDRPVKAEIGEDRQATIAAICKGYSAPEGSGEFVLLYQPTDTHKGDIFTKAWAPASFIPAVERLGMRVARLPLPHKTRVTLHLEWRKFCLRRTVQEERRRSPIWFYLVRGTPRHRSPPLVSHLQMPVWGVRKVAGWAYSPACRLSQRLICLLSLPILVNHRPDGAARTACFPLPSRGARLRVRQRCIAGG